MQALTRMAPWKVSLGSMSTPFPHSTPAARKPQMHPWEPGASAIGRDSSIAVGCSHRPISRPDRKCALSSGRIRRGAAVSARPTIP
jgi:hypothetical protein